MLYRVGPLPDAPLAAASRFYAAELPKIEGELALDLAHLILIFAPADHPHRAWRLAAVQQLARQYAPCRINAVVCQGEPAIAAAAEYLSMAKGISGQLLLLDSHGAGDMIQSPL